MNCAPYCIKSNLSTAFFLVVHIDYAVCQPDTETHLDTVSYEFFLITARGINIETLLTNKDSPSYGSLAAIDATTASSVFFMFFLPYRLIPRASVIFFTVPVGSSHSSLVGHLCLSMKRCYILCLLRFSA